MMNFISSRIIFNEYLFVFFQINITIKNINLIKKSIFFYLFINKFFFIYF